MTGDDWMTDPSDLDRQRGYTRVSLATINDDNVLPGGLLRRTIMRDLDDPRCGRDDPAGSDVFTELARLEHEAVRRHRADLTNRTENAA